MKKAFFLLAIVFVIFFSSFASAHFFQNAVKWVGKNVDSVSVYHSNNTYTASVNFNSKNYCRSNCGHANYSSNYYVVNSYSSTPRNTYYVPQQQYYYGYGSGTYYPRGYYNVYSGSGYSYSGPVVVYD